MKEKITLRYSGSCYIVEELQNRLVPRIGVALRPDSVQDLLTEAKNGGTLTVVIR